MPQLSISLSATIIGRLSAIAQEEEEKERVYNEKATIYASTVAARIIRAYFEKTDQ